MSMTDTTLSFTVLAWLQKELAVYSELLLIHPIRDLSIEYWSSNKPFICFVHRFFPESILDLVQQLQQNQSQFQLLQDHLGVTSPTSLDEERAVINYLLDLKDAIDHQQEDTTLRELYIGNNNDCDTASDISNALQASMQVFEKQADIVLAPLTKLFQQLVSVRDSRHQRSMSLSSSSTTSTTTRSPSPRITFIEDILPIKSRLSQASSNNTNESINPDLSSSTSTIEEIESNLTLIESRELGELRSYYNSLPQPIRLHPELATRISAIDATHAAIHLQLHKGDALLRSTTQFANTAAHIRNELEFIQAKMLKTTTTDTGIQDLEVRAQKVGTLIDQMGVRYFKESPNNFNSGETLMTEQYQTLKEKYGLICAWVEDVRIWFVEAERIRSWIEQRIQLLESKSTVDALNEVELDDITIEEIEALNQDHDLLEKEVELFDKEDMTRLRAHVKALTGTERGNKDLSPADTTTIEITFTTLMTLDRLMHLLRREAYDLQMLTLRTYWEKEYCAAVTWVRSKGESVKTFIQQKARWRPPPITLLDQQNDSGKSKNDVIETLIDFEKQVAAFDQDQFTTTVNLYQDLDDACHIELPSHLESRQVAIEEAFEELTNRIAFSRQVVEQYLVVTDFLSRADQLKSEGDQLRQEITLVERQQEKGSLETLTNHHTEFSEKVASFQENVVRLVTGIAARVPYPEATHPTDAQGNDDANEAIRMVIGARKSALVLFGEALDQSLSSLRRSLQLQKRAKQLQDETNRLIACVDERMRSVKKARVDVFVGKCALDDTDLARLKKERDGQIAKMNGLKENDFKKLQESIQSLQQSFSSHLTQNQQIDTLNRGLVGVSDQLAVLDESLHVHSLCLDVLGKRISWETQHLKSTSWISDMTFQVWDLIARKAQWRASFSVHDGADDLEHYDQEVQYEFESIKEKVEAFRAVQLKSVDQVFVELAQGFSSPLLTNSRNSMDSQQSEDQQQQLAEIVSITPEHVQRRQDALDESFDHLDDLIQFAEDVLVQHKTLTQYTGKVQSLEDSGLQLITDLQSALNNIMDVPISSDTLDSLSSQVEKFDQDVVQLWMHSGSQIPYPQCPEDARATRPTTSDDEISTEVATVVYKTYTDLQDLANRMAELLKRLSINIVYRTKLEAWCEETINTTKDMSSLEIEISNTYIFDLLHQTTADSMVITTFDNLPVAAIISCKQKEQEFTEQITRFETEKYTPLKAQLEEISLSVAADACDIILDVSSLTGGPLGALEAAWKMLVQQAKLFSLQLETCQDGTNWESLCNQYWKQGHDLQDQAREWMNEKNVWISRNNSQHPDAKQTGNEHEEESLKSLVSQLEELHLQIINQDLQPLSKAFQKMLSSSQIVKAVLTDDDNKQNWTVDIYQTKQQDVEKLFSKLHELVETQLSEIRCVQSRHEWEIKVDAQLKSCSEKELETENFIRQMARWSPSNQLVVEVKVNALAQQIHTTTKAKVETLLGLLADLNKLQADVASSDHAVLFQSEAIYKRKSIMESTIDRLKQHDDFVDQVLEQRRVVVSCLEKISDAELLAESTKSRFLSGDDATSSDDYACLASFKAQVDNVSGYITQTALFPVRHYRDHQPQSREEDASHNTMITEMIQARRSRLDDLYINLDSILKSKERLSRRKAAEASYMSEAQAVKEWMEPKRQQLDLYMQKNSTSLDDLRQSVSAVSAFQSAIVTYASTINSLKESATKCIAIIKQQGEESDEETEFSDVDRIESTQASLNQAWDMLCKDINSGMVNLSELLRYAEYGSLVSSFSTQCNKMRQTITDMDISQTTEEISNGWQNELQSLDLDSIKSRFHDEEKLTPRINDEKRADMKSMLDTVLQEFDSLKTLIQTKMTEANQNRLKNEYFTGADALDSLMSSTCQSLDSLKTRFDLIRGQSEEEDKKTVASVMEAYTAISDLYENQHHEKYDEQRSFYRFLQLNKVTNLEEVDVRQLALERRWKQLKLDIADSKQYHVGPISQWFDLHRKLSDMKNEVLSGILDRLNCFERMEKEEESIPAFLEQDESLIKVLRTRMSACLDLAHNLAKEQVQQQLKGKETNNSCFQTRHDELENKVVQAENLLETKKKMAQQHVDLITCQKLVTRAQEESSRYTSLIKSRMDDLNEKVSTNSEVKALESVYVTVVASHLSTEVKQKELVHQSTHVIQPLMDDLATKYGIESTKSDLKQQVETYLSQLDKSMSDESMLIDVTRRILGHKKSAESISEWISKCHAAVVKCLTMDEHDAIELEINVLAQKTSDFEKVVHSFHELSTELLSLNSITASHDDGLVDTAQEFVNSWTENVVRKSLDKVDTEWKSVCEELHQAQKTVKKTTHGVLVARKMKNIMALVGETREYFHGINLLDVGQLPSNLTSAVDEGDSTDTDDDKTQTDETANQYDTKDSKLDNTVQVKPSTSFKTVDGEIAIVQTKKNTDQQKQKEEPLLSMLRLTQVEGIKRSMSALESEMKPQIQQEVSQLEKMMLDFADIDSTFVHQHKELKESVNSLFLLFAEKHAEANKAMEIGKYLTTSDSVELLQSSLEDAINESAPRHSMIIGNNSLSRIDLQAKLIELDACFKYYERKIVQGISEAKEQSQSISSKKHRPMVGIHLSGMEDKWALIKKQFKTRKVELSRSIDTSTDPSDPHSRIRKSSLPTRKATSLLKDRADINTGHYQPRLSPTASSTTSSSSSSTASSRQRTNSNRLLKPTTSSLIQSSNINRGNNRYLSPSQPYIHQPSKSATHVKSKSRNALSTNKLRLNSYVADPNNDLDIEIGRIVNEIPYEVKVKMVPGEVGRYWFGNVNPKLCYCRVLKSKMVMVRVGGGWTELSQFLRDHALLEGDFIPRSQVRHHKSNGSINGSNTTIEEEEEPKSPTFKEGFIETRRAEYNSNGRPTAQNSSSDSSSNTSLQHHSLPTGSPSSSHSTSTAGYKDGDKFIATDSHGNQLEVKMRRVSAEIGRNSTMNDFTRRRIARRKEKNNISINASASTSTSSKISPRLTVSTALPAAQGGGSSSSNNHTTDNTKTHNKK